jgi:hypothetical protein
MHVWKGDCVEGTARKYVCRRVLGWRECMCMCVWKGVGARKMPAHMYLEDVTGRNPRHQSDVLPLLVRLAHCKEEGQSRGREVGGWCA